MPDQIYIGKNGSLKGQSDYLLPFNIDNDAFSLLYNFYAWRGRVKKKRGTITLGRLERQVSIAAVPANYQVAQFALVAGAGNLISNYSLGSTSSLKPGSMSLVVGANTYTDAALDGVLTGAPAGSGTVNYATGAITISGGASSNVIGTFSYFPGVPAMGLEDFVSSTSASQYPLLLAFDTLYSYQINQSSSTVFFYDVNYYKGTNNPFVWSGQDYQQFWTTNYEGALWASNNKPGFNFENISTITVGNPTIIATASPHGLVTGDYVWFNEITGTDASSLNKIAAIVTVTGATTFTVAINTTAMTINNNGIFQTLTKSITGQDGIKWYDGDPTGGTGIPTSTGKGWVNFAPPLTAATVSISNQTAGLYYLVGALAIVAFKDRLLFFSPWIQTSTGNPIQLVDTVIWSWNGTPYYTAGSAGAAISVPTNQTADTTAYYVDQTGKGGFLSAGTAQPIVTVSNNEDVLLVGFGGSGRKTRFVYTGNDLQPFLFFTINSELASSATFSSVSLDRGAIDLGVYGIAMTDQQSSQRIDLEIPNKVFEINAKNNGLQRINSIRDFYKEWIYFSYPVNSSSWKFPTQTLLYNYRENSWAVFYENFTCHGNYRKTSSYTWATLPFKTWASWREPWNSGSTSALFPSVVAGTPQGFVLIKGQGTGEGQSGFIKSIANSNGNAQITSPNHCVNVGDYLYFLGSLGTTAINTQIGRVISTADANTFIVDLPFPAGTYLGNGSFARLCQPLLQTKQFPVYWDEGRKTRLSVQKYLMDTTANGQVTVNIYLSQNDDDAWNDPTNNVPPNSLIYSQLMYTCPESTNIGLTPANTNLQMPQASGQFQIWHRLSTSLIGDSIQIGITLSDTQMRNLIYATSEVVLQGINLVVDRGPPVS